MSSAKKVLAAGAAGMIMVAGGAVPAVAGAATTGAGTLAPPVGSVFSGTIEIASTDGLLVERRQRKQSTSSTLISVDTDAQTVVSRGGQALSIEDLAKGTEVIVSGTKTSDGSVLASKIIIRN